MPRHPGWVRRVFSEADLDAMTEAIRRAESRTSGEIRVHLERRVPREPGDAMARARQVFSALGMERTALRNGVLIYLALEDRKLAIVGDQGVHARVGDAYWAGVRDLMVEALRAGRAAEAVVSAVAEVGRVLAEHYPRGRDDVDELPDRPSAS